MNDFKLDLAYSLEERDNEIFDNFYRRLFPTLINIRFISDLAVQKQGIDKILILKDGREITVDEKKRRKDYGDILLELWSVTEAGKLGWLYTCQAEYVVYAIMPSRKAYLLPVILLKRAWYNHENEWKLSYPIKLAPNPWRNPIYHTTNIHIPPKILLGAISQEMEHHIEKARAQSLIVPNRGRQRHFNYQLALPILG